MTSKVQTNFVSLEEIKSKFFDREIRKKISKSKFDLMSKTGAFIQRSARSSMKKAPSSPPKAAGTYGRARTTRTGRQYFQKGRYSAPGKPPFYRSERNNLRTILFGFENENTLLVGPIYLPGKMKQSRPAPAVQELGGRVTRAPRRRRATASFSIQSRKRNRASTANYKARPFMFPAGKKGVADLQRKAKGFIV